ncbi:MAG: hypothetical protein OXE05_05730 [Chloroflexi bacterium]|nr:hypothetical protein [Chloroflexota bacterium]
MITLVWNDIPATQLMMASQKAQSLADAAPEKEETLSWARAAIGAATAVDPVECDLAPFQTFAAALTALDDEQIVKDAAEALAKHPQALFTLAAAAREKGWNELADAVIVRCLAQTVAMAWPDDYSYQREWKQQYEEQLVGTLLKVWKKRASRTVAKQAVSLAGESEELDAKQVEEKLKALLTPADLWPRPVQRGRQARGRQSSATRSRSGGRRPATTARSQRSPSRSRTTRKPEGEAK